MTFKACVFGALASVFAAGAATAADLPSVKSAPTLATPTAFNWDGWYIGVVGGYGGGSVSSTARIWNAPVGAAQIDTSVGTQGWLVGYETGYNWQFANNFVLGYESEFSYADVSNSAGFGVSTKRLEWFGSERVRFGYAMGRFLPYITGGLAYGRTRSYGIDNFNGFLFQSNGSAWQAGWTVGAGLEYAIFDRVTVKAEYLYTQMKGPSGLSLGAPGGFYTFSGRDFDTHLARVGVNFHFSGPMALLDSVGLRF